MGWCKHCAQNRQMERDPINGFLCCCSCGRVIDQDVFSTEVTFVKGAGGQSQMSGNYVRTVQGEHSELHERTLNKGRDEISDMVVSLGVGGGNSIIDPAFAFYKLCKLLRLEEHPIVQKPVDPSLFIHRFTERLLGGKNIDVSRAALRIIASMKRDWMQTGRKPSGLCGAALYISALSHGLRYSKSDVIEEFNTKVKELENEVHLKQLNVGSKMSGMTELLCEHKGRGDAHFAHGLCKLCYKDFVELSGGLQGGSEPPAFQRAERERMEKASAEGVRESSPGSTPCHRDNGQKQFEKGEESVRENHPGVIENDRMDSGAAAEDHFVYQDGSCQSQGNEDMDNVAGDESESFSDIDDVEVDGYLHNEEEKHYKKIIWEEMNREYLEERKQKREANAKNGTPAQTAAEATREMLTKKTAPENSKKKRVESDHENDDYGQQISEESGEKVVSDVVDNNDDFREDDYEEGDGDGLYYGNEEDGYGYDDEY